MRNAADLESLRTVMYEIGRMARSPGKVYVVGGASALALNIRARTIDIDLKLDPEPEGVFEAIAHLKEALHLNIELASPDQFVPALPGWKERSMYIATHGLVEFRHFDLYTQALAKIERGHAIDLLDVEAFIERGFVNPDELRSLFALVRDELLRYPAIDASSLDAKVTALQLKR